PCIVVYKVINGSYLDELCAKSLTCVTFLLMSLYNGPPRPGARGGRDQFSWDNVKADKDREYYLGHSVKALAGRWQKGRDVYWYTREKSGQDTLQDEIQAVKQREEELMLEALGLKPKSAAVKPAPQLDKHELDELIRGKPQEEGGGMEGGGGGAEGGGGAGAQEADRVKGLGFVAGTAGATAEAVHVTLPGLGPAQQPPAGGPRGQQQGAGGRLPPPPPLPPGMLGAAGGALGPEQLKQLRRAEKRAKKEAKKAKKEAKKEAKREAKRAKRAREAAQRGEGGRREEQDADRKRRRHRSSSPSSSGSSSSSSSDSEGEEERHRHRRSSGHRHPVDARDGPLAAAAGSRGQHHGTREEDGERRQEPYQQRGQRQEHSRYEYG
ncbi:hypothetical protein Agub_g13517, partial [Astrephomene gubernaculifera]